MLVQVVGLYTELYTYVNYAVWEQIVRRGGGSFLTCPNALQGILGTANNGSPHQTWLSDTGRSHSLTMCIER